MTTRLRILSRIRKALDRQTLPSEAERSQAVSERLAQAPAHWPLPSVQVSARADPAQEMPTIERFKAQLTGVGADLIEVRGGAEIPPAVADYITSGGAAVRARALRMGTDPFLTSLPWASCTALRMTTGKAQPSDAIGLSRAVAAVAETGTLVLISGPENPVTLSYLPETHIVVLAANAIVDSYEQAMGSMLASTNGRMPRTINLITGASRTGDIGGKIVMGAHGPRKLAVVLWGRNA